MGSVDKEGIGVSCGSEGGENRDREWGGKGRTHSSLVGEKELEAFNFLQLDVLVEGLGSDLKEGEARSGACVEGRVVGEGEDVSFDLHREGARWRRKEEGRHVVEGGCRGEGGSISRGGVVDGTRMLPSEV